MRTLHRVSLVVRPVFVWCRHAPFFLDHISPSISSLFAVRSSGCEFQFYFSTVSLFEFVIIPVDLGFLHDSVFC